MPYKSILLIDDDEDDQEIFQTAVGEAGKSTHCIAINDAALALVKLAAKEIVPDVIFLDLNMPVMNGQQFLFQIQQNKDLRNIPIIIFSTTAHLPTIQLTKDLGAVDFITKPSNYDELVKILAPFLC